MLYLLLTLNLALSCYLVWRVHRPIVKLEAPPPDPREVEREREERNRQEERVRRAGYKSTGVSAFGLGPAGTFRNGLVVARMSEVQFPGYAHKGGTPIKPKPRVDCTEEEWAEWEKTCANLYERDAVLEDMIAAEIKKHESK